MIYRCKCITCVKDSNDINGICWKRLNKKNIDKNIKWNKYSIYSWRANHNNNMMIYYIWGSVFERCHDTINARDIPIIMRIIYEILNFINMIYNICSNILIFILY